MKIWGNRKKKSGVFTQICDQSEILFSTYDHSAPQAKILRFDVSFFSFTFKIMNLKHY